MSEGASTDRGRGTVDPNRVPISLWLGAIIALAAAALAGYLVFGRDEPAPPSQGAALTIGDATAALLTPQKVGAGAAERPDDTAADAPTATLDDADPDDDCSAGLDEAGLASWDPLATDGDPLARHVLTIGTGTLSESIAASTSGDPAAVREAIEQCPEVALQTDQGAGSVRLSVAEPTGDAADVGDDRVVIAATVTGADGAQRTLRAVLWERDGLVTTVTTSSGPGQPDLPVDEARLAQLVGLADDHLSDALEAVS